MRTNKIDITKLKVLEIPQGFTLRLVHHSTPEDLQMLRASPCAPAPKYATTATLYDAEGRYVTQGESFCNPKDQPSRKLGNLIARNRCIKRYHKYFEASQNE